MHIYAHYMRKTGDFPAPVYRLRVAQKIRITDYLLVNATDLSESSSITKRI